MQGNRLSIPRLGKIKSVTAKRSRVNRKKKLSAAAAARKGGKGNGGRARAAQRALCVQIYCTAHGDAFMRELFRHPLDVPRLGNLLVNPNQFRQRLWLGRQENLFPSDLSVDFRRRVRGPTKPIEQM